MIIIIIALDISLRTFKISIHNISASLIWSAGLMEMLVTIRDHCHWLCALNRRCGVFLSQCPEPFPTVLNTHLPRKTSWQL